MLKKKSLTSSLVLLSLGVLTAPYQASADPTFKRNDDQFINIGIASRLSYESREDAAPNGTDRSNDFTLEEARLYTNGKVHKNVSFEFNFARNRFNNDDLDSNDIELLDGRIGFEFNNYANLWVGRFLPPSSRASAAAPAYSTTFDFPLAEPAVVGSNLQFGGRDNGAALWGSSKDEAFKYQFGAFRGRNGGSNQSDELAYAGRLQYNFWDTEPGFYNLANYDGAKSILSVGASYKYQKDGAGTINNAGDHKAWSVDARLEKPLKNGGVLGAEATYYDYDNDKTLDATAPEANGYFALGSYTFPQTIGIGKIQPRISYQRIDNDTTELDLKRTDIGFGYLINGSSNIRIDTYYYQEDRNQGKDIDGLKVLVHLAHFF